ncbi:chaperone modulator CbpM [Pseudodesulfovibrio sp.]|nr:chaperone modulator CbpM [Pseudodesulfovibrio sp.]
MPTKRLMEMVQISGLNLPEPSEFVAWTQLVELTSIEPSEVAELVDLGWISPTKTSAEEYLFRLRDVYRIYKLKRLTTDLDMSFNSGSIIVDLLDRVEELEKEVEELKRLV